MQADLIAPKPDIGCHIGGNADLHRIDQIVDFTGHDRRTHPLTDKTCLA